MKFNIKLCIEKLFNYYQKCCLCTNLSRQESAKQLEYITKELDIITQPSLTTIYSIENSTIENTEWMSMENINCQGKVVCVNDKYNITMIIPFCGLKYKFKCILDIYKKIEISEDNDEVKQFLIELILNKIVWTECGKFDKYGRLIVKLYLIENNIKQCINDIIIEKGFRYYDKEVKKKIDEDWCNIES